MKKLLITPMTVTALIILTSMSAFAEPYDVDFNRIDSSASQKDKMNQTNSAAGLHLTSNAFDSIIRWQRNQDRMSAVANFNQVHYVREQPQINAK